MKYKVAPSLLAADFSCINEEISKVEKAGADLLHLDVMDGVFVNNISFGIPVIKTIRKCTKLPFDVHLMIIDPIKYIDQFVDAGADSISFHYEACSNHEEVIDRIKSHGKKACLAISPETSAEVARKFKDKLDMLLIMTVRPGFGGQKLIESTLENIKIAKDISRETGYRIPVQVDGGINRETLHLVTEAGAEIIVVGNAIFSSDNPKEVIDYLKEGK